jgi:uncharacterized delta-60 repeat protein
MRKCSLALVALVVAGVVSVTVAAAAGGSLDASFGIGGEVTTDFSGGSPDLGEAVAIQSDGKIIVGGATFPNFLFDETSDFALARYNRNGTLDTNFGSGGKVTTAFGAGSSEAVTGIAIQADGRIVAGGYSDSSGSGDFALARYNGDGTLDTSFGNGGKVTTDFNRGSAEGASAIALRPDGKIVLAGFSNVSGTHNFALARYNSNGTLDTSFGNGGEVTPDFGGSDLLALALDRKGRIIAIGRSDQASGNTDFALARFESEGRLDVSFGSGGEVTTDFGDTVDVALAVLIQRNGKIVAIGASYQSPGVDGDFALARYNTQGTLDTSFGNGGKVTTDFSGSLDVAEAAAPETDGKIIVAGQSDAAGSGDFAVARYDSHGVLDATFGSGGKVTTDVAGGGDVANAVALQANGKIVAAGTSGRAVLDSDFALVRYLAE